MVPAGIPGLLAILLATRFLLGVGEAMVFPAPNRLVAGWIPSQERGLANGLIFAGGATLPWRVILGSRDVWALTVSYFAFGYVSYILFAWFSIYLNKVRGLDLKSSAFFGMLPFLAMATFSPVGGYLSERLTKRYGQRVGRCGISVACMAVAAALCMVGSLAWLLVNRERARSRRALKVESQPALS